MFSTSRLASAEGTGPPVAGSAADLGAVVAGASGFVPAGTPARARRFADRGWYRAISLVVLVGPILQALRSVPLLGLIPLFIVWFGIGQLPKVLFVMLSALFPVYLNTFAGIRGVDGRLGEFGRVLRLRRGEMIRHIVLPGALPSALTGLQLSVVASLLALVVGEQINATSGLGFMITQAQQFLNNSVIMVALIVYSVLGLLLNGAVRLLERDVGFTLPSRWP